MCQIIKRKRHNKQPLFNEKISKTKWFKGYDMDDVDDYLDNLICKIRQLFDERYKNAL
jgi:cell division septum initiation protein DivIVA